MNPLYAFLMEDPVAPVKPFFKHDCDYCMFMFRSDSARRRGFLPAGKSDVYVCQQGGFPTGIVRNGDDGWEYASADRYIPEIYLQMREDFGDEGDEIVKIAKSYLRNGRKNVRKWRSDYRRKKAREMRRMRSKPDWFANMLAGLPSLPD